MSQSPEQATETPGESYLDGWQQLATRIRHGNSFSGREPNSCFLNTGSRRFADMSWISGCGFDDDARALATTDWDGDGDLDLWWTNRTAPRVRFLRNDSDRNGNYLRISLEGDPERRCPRDAVGAVVDVEFEDGRRFTRSLSAGDGFLSQSSKWLHFGLGDAASVPKVSVSWPGTPNAEVFGPVEANVSLRLKQGSGKASRVKPRRTVRLTPRPWQAPEVEPSSRVVLRQPAELPPMIYQTPKRERLRLPTDRAVLVLFWASWCRPCLVEMAEMAKRAAELESTGLFVVAMNIEGAQKDAPTSDSGEWEKTLTKISWPFASGYADGAFLTAVESVRQRHVYKTEPLPLPSSMLLHQGKLVSLEKGAVNLDKILSELNRLAGPPSRFDDHAVGLPGSWSTQYFVSHPVAIAKKYLEGGYPQDARKYLQRSLESLDTPDERRRRFQEADIRYMLGEADRLEGKPWSAAMIHYEQAYQGNPDHPMNTVLLARAYRELKQAPRAVLILKVFVDKHQQRPDAWLLLGESCLDAGQETEAVEAFERAYALQPKEITTIIRLCWLYATASDTELRKPQRALQFAELLRRSGAMERYSEAADSVAAAYANAGRFEEAVAVLDEAITRIEAREDSERLGAFQTRRALYAAGKPYRSGPDRQER